MTDTVQNHEPSDAQQAEGTATRQEKGKGKATATADPSFTFVVNPRRGKVSGASKTSTAPVQLTLETLKPYFRKPLNDACLELGLSASAIKKACRMFGIPKWPCRSLTARHSINREVMEAVSEGRASTSPTVDVPVIQASSSMPQAEVEGGSDRRQSLRSFDQHDHGNFNTALHSVTVSDTDVLWSAGIDAKQEESSVLTTDLSTSTPKQSPTLQAEAGAAVSRIQSLRSFDQHGLSNFNSALHSVHSDTDILQSAETDANLKQGRGADLTTDLSISTPRHSEGGTSFESLW